MLSEMMCCDRSKRTPILATMAAVFAFFTSKSSLIASLRVNAVSYTSPETSRCISDNENHYLQEPSSLSPNLSFLLLHHLVLHAFHLPIALKPLFFSLHHCTPSLSYFRYYTTLSLYFSLLAVLHNTVLVLDLRCETRDTGWELMTHWNDLRGDAYPSVLGVPLALVIAYLRALSWRGGEL